MAGPPELDGIRALYERGLADHGPQAPSVGWKDEVSQLLRFEKLAEVIDTAEPVTVNDLGCGYGALFPFLAARADVALTGYRGYDISADMVEAARSLVTDERAEFLVGRRIDGEADYGFASGTFNVRLDATEADWEAHVKETLRELDATSRRGFAFNLLSTYVDWQEPHLYYGDPLHYFDHCKRTFSSYVVLLHDYPLWEWTLVVRKPVPR